MEHAPPPRAVSVVANVMQDGRVVFPAAALAELGLRADAGLKASLVDGELVVDSLEAAIKRAQEVLAPYIADGPSIVDELIAERRAEALRE